MRVVIYLSVSGILLHFSIAVSQVLAQITSDGSVPTRVETMGDLTEVTGGELAGNNLFHSFREFSIPTRGIVRFNNPDTVTNIINRVTGNTISTIDGTIAVNSKANVFLINPNGIIFGANARLNIGGSFLATTAESIRFADGSEFSAKSTSSPVLSVTVPIGLQFGSAPREIVNRSTGGPAVIFPSGLQVPFGQTLALVGGDIRLDSGNLTAFGGRVTLGSVGEGSFVSLIPNGQGWRLGYEGVSRFQDIRLSAGASIDASGPEGTIDLQGRQVTLEGSSQIVITTSGQRVQEPSDGTSGNPELIDGTSGNLTINASDSISLITSPEARFATLLFLETSTAADSGNISLNTSRLNLQGGSLISAGTTGPGNAGQIEINASKSVEIAGVGPRFPTLITSSSGPARRLTTDSNQLGNGGDITINTGRFILRDGAQIQSATGDGPTLDINGKPTQGFGGLGGTIEITATESIEISGTGIVPNVQAVDGTIQVQVVSSSLSTSTGFEPSRFSGSNTAGNIRLNTPRLTVSNGAEILVDSFQSSGEAGNLRVNAGSILLDNQALLSANSSSGSGGNIELKASEFLSLRRNSAISANAGNQGDGGNILMIAPLVLAVPSENSDISANAEGGRGGNVIIITEGIFGIQFRELPTDLSDITVSSRFAQSGTFTLSRFDSDPQGELVNSPVEVIDTENLIVRTCDAGGRLTRGEFTITGRGGLPSDPDRILEIRDGLADFGDRPATGSTPALHSLDRTASPPPETIIEAKGWIVREGKIVLVDQSFSSISSPSPFATPDCHLGSNRS
jgi:filamentous hemagglutinin family protein